MVTTSTTSTGYTCWINWNSPYSATSTTTVWYDWNNIHCNSINSVTSTTVEWQEQQKAAAEKRNLARSVAKEVLLSLLDEEQQKQFEEKSYFDLRIDERIYRINGGVVTRIDSEGKPLTRYCIHPVDYIPGEDWAIAQKLMLETDEKEFLRVANASAA
jgi:hypothetical protein